jgi:hypothetical protein
MERLELEPFQFVVHCWVVGFRGFVIHAALIYIIVISLHHPESQSSIFESERKMGCCPKL